MPWMVSSKSMYSRSIDESAALRLAALHVSALDVEKVEPSLQVSGLQDVTVKDGQLQVIANFAYQVENAGIKLRRLDRPDIEKFPSNGFIALEETLKEGAA